MQSANVETIGIVAEHYARGAPTASIGELLGVLTESAPASAEAVIAGLAKGWPRESHVELDAAANQAIDRLLARLSTGGKGQLITLAIARLSSRINEVYAADLIGASLGCLALIPLLDRIGAPGVVLTAAGLACLAALAAIASPPIKDRLRTNTDEAIARGAFGAPAMFVGDQLFWGNDRLPFVEAALRG